MNSEKIVKNKIGIKETVKEIAKSFIPTSHGEFIFLVILVFVLSILFGIPIPGLKKSDVLTTKIDEYYHNEQLIDSINEFVLTNGTLQLTNPKVYFSNNKIQKHFSEIDLSNLIITEHIYGDVKLINLVYRTNEQHSFFIEDRNHLLILENNRLIFSSMDGSYTDESKKLLLERIVEKMNIEID